MERWQIIAICIVVGVIWMMFKRQRSSDGSTSRDHSLEDRIEGWFQGAQDRVAALPQDIREERAGSWEAMSREAQIGVAERFMSVNFGPASLGRYNSDEKLKIGEAHYVADGPDPES
jgi:hypothetical protein